MALPFEPQSVDELKARYPAAVAVVFDAEAVNTGTALRPGQSRTHVFDCHDGVRLLVSRVRDDLGHVRLHVSASLEPGSTLFEELRKLRKPQAVMKRFRAKAEAAYRVLSGNIPPVYLRALDSNVLHWLSDEEKDEQEAKRDGGV